MNGITAYTVYVEKDGSAFSGFWHGSFMHNSNTGYGKDHREVDFEKDELPPLLIEASQIKPGDYQKMLELFQKAKDDPDWNKSVTLRHYKIQSPYYTQEFGHYFSHDFPKGGTHKCSTLSLIKLIEEKLYVENLPTPQRQIYHLGLGSRAALISLTTLALEALALPLAFAAIPILLTSMLAYTTLKYTANVIYDGAQSAKLALSYLSTTASD